MGCLWSCHNEHNIEDWRIYNIPDTAKRIEKFETNKSKFWCEKNYLWKVHTEKEMKEISSQCDNNLFMSKIEPHPHMCLPHTVDLIKCHMVIRMPLANADLFELLKGSFDETYVLNQLVGIASAISHLHKQGRAHRDIKAENIVLYQNKLCLIDFDFAYPTQKLVRCGTKGFMIPRKMLDVWPEMSATEISKKSDVYAFGKLVFNIFWHCGVQKKLDVTKSSFLFDAINEAYLENTKHPFNGLYAKWADVAVRCIQKVPPSQIPVYLATGIDTLVTTDIGTTVANVQVIDADPTFA